VSLVEPHVGLAEPVDPHCHGEDPVEGRATLFAERLDILGPEQAVSLGVTDATDRQERANVVEPVAVKMPLEGVPLGARHYPHVDGAAPFRDLDGFERAPQVVRREDAIPSQVHVIIPLILSVIVAIRFSSTSIPVGPKPEMTARNDALEGPLVESLNWICQGSPTSA